MADALREVIDDPEIHKIRVAALKLEAATDPLGFERTYVMPRLQKLSAGSRDVKFAEMTPAEEAALMDELTVARKEIEEIEDAKFAQETIEVGS